MYIIRAGCVAVVSKNNEVMGLLQVRQTRTILTGAGLTCTACRYKVGASLPCPWEPLLRGGVRWTHCWAPYSYRTSGARESIRKRLSQCLSVPLFVLKLGPYGIG